MASHTFFCIDGHTCGNPVRVVAGGAPALAGSTMLEKRAHFLAEFDWIRHALMFEPRGHDMMSGAILYPPMRPDCDAAILFIETSGCLPMCGHGTIGTVTTMIERGLVTPATPGRLKIDVAYGGNFYAIIDPQESFNGLEHIQPSQVLQWSPLVRKVFGERFAFQHPEKPEIGGLSHVMWTGKPLNPRASGRNAVFYGDKAIDRSPCGTGTSARMAQWAAMGKLREGQDFVHESIIGSEFVGRIAGRTKVGDKDAIVPTIQGWGRVTGFN